MRSNLDIWAIQDDSEELEIALANIEPTSKNNILFSNCFSSLRIGDKIIQGRQFDTMLYAEDSDTCVILMQGGAATIEDMRKNLNARGIFYHEVIFDPLEQDKECNCGGCKKTLWFARDIGVLEDAIDDSDKQGFDTCVYYPNVDGSLELQYSFLNEKYATIDGRDFRGVIEFSDKIILLIHQQDPRNVSDVDVYHTLSNRSIDVSVSDSLSISSLEECVKQKKI